jgi:hypothetical protein
MSEEWRSDPATEKQKEKLLFFGCTWSEGITKGQASDAIGECVQKFPEKEAEWQSRRAERIPQHGEEIPSDFDDAGMGEPMELWSKKPNR